MHVSTSILAVPYPCNQYDTEKGMGLLVETWVSKANAKQRRGRAGRVRSGHCYRLYTRKKFESFADQPVGMKEQTAQEATGFNPLLIFLIFMPYTGPRGAARTAGADLLDHQRVGSQ